MNGIVLIVLIFLIAAGALGAVAYFTYQRKLRRAKAIERGLKMVPILIHLPPPSADTEGGNRDIREVMREKTSQAEVLYNLISGTATEGFKSNFYGQRHIALELIAINSVVHFFVAVPVALVSTVTKAVQTAYPGARLEEVEDHNIFNQQGRLAATLGGEMVLRAESAYPIATYAKLERDPMEALLTTISALEKQDGVAVQIMLRPANAGWTRRSIALADAKRKNRGEGLTFSAMDLAKAAIKSPVQRREEERARMGGAPEVSNLELAEVESIEEKTKHPAFEVLIRVIVSTSSVPRSQQLLRDIATAFALFETPGMNGFKFLPALDVQGLVTAFIFRFFPPELKSNVLNSSELATLFHLPDSQFTPTTSVVRQQSKQVDGPVQLPMQGLLFGHNEFRGVKKEIRLSLEDRRRHTYILGQTGTGKSTMLENLAVQDMLAGNGFAFIDPHGDSAEKLLSMVPKSRAEDVVYFNPSDTQYPLGLNLFEFNDPSQKDFIVQETINMLYKLYDPGHTGIIGPRYEHWYRNAALTLMSDPNGATFIEIPKVFTDTDYLKAKFKYLKDPTVIDFWTKEMGQTSDYHKSEMLGWFVSKFGAFQNNEMMRNIIGQTKSAFNIREIMDQKKILIVNLSKGRVGELNSQLLGMIFVIKFQAAAMSRADMPESERTDFALYVDEFQNFSTDSFASILSEARKYRLNLIVANQFIGQLSDEIRDAVFGNIGSIVAHRMGPEDAEFMVKQFAPIFDVSDLVNIPNYNAVMRLMIGGLPSQPFTLHDSAPLSGANVELGMAIKQLSAAKFGRTKAQVEADILDRFSGHGVRSADLAPVAPGAPGGAADGAAGVGADLAAGGVVGVGGAGGAVPASVAAPALAFAPVAPTPAFAPTPAPAPVAPTLAPAAMAATIAAPVAPVPAAVAPTPALATEPMLPVSTPGAVAPYVPGSAVANGAVASLATTPPPIGAPPIGAPPIGIGAPVPAASAATAAPVSLVGQSLAPVAMSAPVAPAVASSDLVFNTAGQIMTASAGIIPEDNFEAEADQMVQAGGFNQMGTPLPTPASPAPGVVADMAMTPPPIGAPPIGVNMAGVPPIGAPPVDLPRVEVAAPVLSPLPSPTAVVPGAPVGDAGTLSFRDITGGKTPPLRAVDPMNIPVMTPGIEPPIFTPPVAPLPDPVAPFVPESGPARQVAPLGSGAPLPSDPYAKIDVLGDLTAPVAQPAAMAGQVEGRPFVAPAAPAPSGQPLPDDPYAKIDVLGAMPMPPAREAAQPDDVLPLPTVRQQSAVVEQAVAPPEEALAPAEEALAPVEQAEVLPEEAPFVPEPSAPVEEPDYLGLPGVVAEAAPMPAPAISMPAEVAPTPVQTLPPVATAAPVATAWAEESADVREQTVPEPVEALGRFAAPPVPLPPPAPMPEVLAQSAPEIVPPAHEPTVEELIHFVDPNAQAVLERPDVPEAVSASGNPMLNGLPEGISIVEPPAAASASVAPAAPVAVTGGPGVPQMAVSLEKMATTPPPIGAAPVNVAPAFVAPAPAVQAVTPQPPAEPEEAQIAKAAGAVPVPAFNASLVEALEKAPDTQQTAVENAKSSGPESPIDKLESVADMLEESREAGHEPEVTATPKVAEPVQPAAKAETVQPAAKAETVQAAAQVEPAAPEPKVPESAVPEPKLPETKLEPHEAPAITRLRDEPRLGETPGKPLSGADQIEKAEREIDDLLSVSLLHPEPVAGGHHRLPDAVALPQEDETGIDMELNAAREKPQVAVEPAPVHVATEHHGLKVIQPLEPIVPPREQFAKELAAMQAAGQSQTRPAAGPPAAAAARKDEKHRGKKPFFALGHKHTEAQAGVSPAPGAPKPGASAPVPRAAAGQPVQPRPTLPVQYAATPAPTDSFDDLPQAESLAVGDVAAARAQRQAEEQRAMQTPSPGQVAPPAPAAVEVLAPVPAAAPEVAKVPIAASEPEKPALESKKPETPADGKPAEEKAPAVEKPAEDKAAADKPAAARPAAEKPDAASIGRRNKRKRVGREKQVEHIESKEEAEHNKPTEAEAEASSLTGKLILPTGERPTPEPVQPKVDKPKKLAPGEVFVDEHGNVIIGE